MADIRVKCPHCHALCFVDTARSARRFTCWNCARVVYVKPAQSPALALGSAMGGAAIGGAVGGPPGAVLGGFAGFVIGALASKS